METGMRRPVGVVDMSFIEIKNEGADSDEKRLKTE
jgi:hypothetical protein